jgi:hypothetical protein
MLPGNRTPAYRSMISDGTWFVSPATDVMRLCLKHCHTLVAISCHFSIYGYLKQPCFSPQVLARPARLRPQVKNKDLYPETEVPNREGGHSWKTYSLNPLDLRDGLW